MASGLAIETAGAYCRISIVAGATIRTVTTAAFEDAAVGSREEVTDATFATWSPWTGTAARADAANARMSAAEGLRVQPATARCLRRAPAMPVAGRGLNAGHRQLIVALKKRTSTPLTATVPVAPPGSYATVVVPAVYE